MREKIAAANNIFKSFRLLKGNTRISVVCEPLWGIPFVLFNFYLSLYMKEMGVTDQQLGYLISLGYISGTVFSMISGAVTDRLGRRKTTMIFDFISWPVVAAIYFISNNFLLFALATIINNLNRIVNVSWNLMIIEDADNQQRVAAFNLLNIINISSGIFIPLTGILVTAYGVIVSERIFFVIAMISMTVMVLVRNHLYRETSVGRHILDERKKNHAHANFKNLLPTKAAANFKGKPAIIIAALVYILFYIYIPLGTFNSLYFAPFMTEVLGIGKSSISVLGGVYSAVMLIILVFVMPVISKLNHVKNMQTGLAIQIASLTMLILIPAGSMVAAVLCIAAYAAGFGVLKPFVDSMLAEVTEGNERAGIYSLLNTITCIFTALIGFASGGIYLYNPRFIYVLSIIILITIIILLGVYYRMRQKNAVEANA